MRRYLTGALLTLFVTQSSGMVQASLPLATSRATTSLSSAVAVAGRSGPPGPIIRHTPLPERPLGDYADRKRFSPFILKLNAIAKDVRAGRPLDLTKLPRIHVPVRSETTDAATDEFARDAALPTSGR